jgi:hypothetical protein
MNNDEILLQEAYEHVQEGMWDQFKANTAGNWSGASGRGKQALGTVKGAWAGATGDIEGVEAAQAQKRAGATQGMDAKSLSIVNSHLKRLKKFVTNFKNDLKALGMDIEEIRETNPEAAAALTSIETAVTQVSNAFNEGGVRDAAHHKLKTNVQGSYKANTTSSERDMMKRLGLSSPSG